MSSANITLGSMSMKAEQNVVELAETNRVLTATCDLNRELYVGVPLAEASRVVVEAARKAFNVNRCLCMVRDEAEQVFVGQLLDGDEFHEVKIPVHLAGLEDYSKQNGVTDIEAEALQRLQRTTVDIANGSELRSGALQIAAGSQFLATFFLADRHSQVKGGPVLGELIVDFQDAVDLRYEGVEVLTRNFESLALAASNAIDRVLMARDLAGQAQGMAEASRKMEESQRQLFHSHRLATVGRLAAGAAHEINNPLTIISLNTQILARSVNKFTNGEELQGRLKIIADQEERISKIIQELMGFARPAQPKFCQARVDAIMEKVLGVIGDRVSMAKVKVDNLIPDDLPNVMVDPLQIEQVFMNLLINANHAMPDGGAITLEAEEARSGFIEVRVTDTGTGIDAKDMGKIFDPFFTTKKEGEGSGLGLAVCNSIVEHNGGAMRVTSKLGQSSTFFVTMPVDKGSRLRAMKEDLKQEKEGGAICAIKEKCRILVVDDERILNDMLQDSLRGAGFEVDGAYDGVEGIGQLRFKRYRVVLLDIRMPRKDGLDVLRFIKEEYPDIQVIIITGLASKQEVKETVKKGAFACLKKPFRFEKVLETINSALQACPCKK